MATIPQIGGGGAGGGGWVRIVDIATQDPGGNVTEKVYQDEAGTVLQSCKVSHLDIEISLKASYPLVDIGGSTYQLAPSPDEGHYSAVVLVTVSAGPVSVQLQTPENTPGATDTVDVTYDAPPEILTLEFTGGYPGIQTELKAGDTFQLTGTTDKDIDAIDIQDYGAMGSSLEVVAVGTSFLVTGTIADRGTTTQNLSARVRPRAPGGALGAVADTNTGGGGVDGVNLVKLNNTYPSISWGAITYPAGQQALKGSESATVVANLANYTSRVFSHPLGELNFTGTPPNINAQRVGGTYNVSNNNVRCTLVRAENGAQTISETLVKIANVAPIINVSAASRLRSGGNDGTSIQNHTITIQSNQQLLSAAMDAAPGGGAFTGSWAGGPSNWTRTLQVHDNDAKGNYSWQNLVATGLAGLVTNSITAGAAYVLGGFVSRTLTFGPFATTTTMNVEVVDFSKLQAGVFTATSQAALRQAIGTPPSVTNGYTILSAGVKPTTVVWLDTAAAGSNSSGTAQITNVQEAV